MKNTIFGFYFLCYTIAFGVSKDDDDDYWHIEDKTPLWDIIAASHHNSDAPGLITPEKKQDSRYKPGEVEGGDLADLFGTNVHKMIPSNYPDFARRFVPQYPYLEKPASQIDNEAEMRLDQAIKEAIKKVANDEERLRPVRAPPEVVLAIAKQSASLQKRQPFEQPDRLFEKDILRSGNYWNNVWKEDVPDPANENLRSGKRVESVRIKVLPGSRLYKLVSITKEMSPRFLYVINNNNLEK